jgi:hypothetical protein
VALLEALGYSGCTRDVAGCCEICQS